MHDKKANLVVSIVSKTSRFLIDIYELGNEHIDLYGPFLMGCLESKHHMCSNTWYSFGMSAPQLLNSVRRAPSHYTRCGPDQFERLLVIICHHQDEECNDKSS